MNDIVVGITGDTHGDLNFSQVYKARKLGVTHLIVCGDFGYIWNGNLKEQKRLNYLNKIGVKVLFIDGNHDNHVLLNNYPVSEMYGGKVHEIRDNIIHLIRGEIYEINNKKYFAFGGANSTDLQYYDLYGRLKHRVEGKNWWREEKPSVEEGIKALENLSENNWEVDYIITHTCYSSAILRTKKENIEKRVDDVSSYLDSVKHLTKFKYWFFGHMHANKDMPDINTRCIYKDIVII